MTRFDAVNIGIATQTDAGLMVPVVRHAEARDLWASAAEVARLADAARTGKATRDELSGSTITITSLGPLGGIVTTPVINAPEVAIVGVNRIVERPVVRDERDRAAALDEPLVVVRPPGDRRAARRGVRAGAERAIWSARRCCSSNSFSLFRFSCRNPDQRPTRAAPARRESRRGTRRACRAFALLPVNSVRSVRPMVAGRFPATRPSGAGGGDRDRPRQSQRARAGCQAGYRRHPHRSGRR